MWIHTIPTWAVRQRRVVVVCDAGRLHVTVDVRRLEDGTEAIDLRFEDPADAFDFLPERLPSRQ